MGMRPKPTTEYIRHLRVSQECGIYEAREMAMREWRIEVLNDFRRSASGMYTIEQCRDAIVDLLDYLQDCELA